MRVGGRFLQTAHPCVDLKGQSQHSERRSETSSFVLVIFLPLSAMQNLRF